MIDTSGAVDGLLAGLPIALVILIIGLMINIYCTHHCDNIQISNGFYCHKCGVVND